MLIIGALLTRGIMFFRKFAEIGKLTGILSPVMKHSVIDKDK